MAKQPATSTSRGEGGKVRVLVEMKVHKGMDVSRALSAAKGVETTGFQLDTSYKPVPVSPSPELKASLDIGREETVIVRGSIEENKIKELQKQPDVIKVWKDTHIQPFAGSRESEKKHFVVPSAAKGNCPLTPCDCSFGDPANGTIEDVARYLGVDQIWAAGYKGEGIAIGIVDGGITAIGRTPKPGETAKIDRVVDGWPSDWGTTAAAWGDHGNMTATDALGMAPNAEIYDIRISDGDAISDALAGFQWAIDKHRATGKPQILSNSWGIFQENWDPDYARDPDHPFTRKVIDAINEGILVLFAAGNCGQTCPDGRCNGDNGPGKSIWGANGHPEVMTVGAVNLNERWVGYSSQGPAALDPHKPDFCSLTHFEGYFPNKNPNGASDGGTSAATPIASGVVSLLKQANPTITQGRAKDVLKQTAKNIGPAGWDQHSGSGIMQAKAAFDLIKPEQPPEDRCKRYTVYLNNVLLTAFRRPTLQTCLCHYVCGVGDQPKCSKLELSVVTRVIDVLKQCPELKKRFCSSLRCDLLKPKLAFVEEEMAEKGEMLEAELELACLEEEMAPEEEMLEAELELACLEERMAPEEELFEPEMELAALEKYKDPCPQYLPYLKRVITAASGNPGLRRCICYYVCRIGPRPICNRAEIDIIRKVLDILKICPQYRAPFCRNLRCG